MREVFRLPDVGEGIAEAEIVEYLVQVGDKVKADQPVIRVETDKAVVELPAPFSGTVAEIPHKPGDTVRVGDPLIIIETDVAARPAAPPKEAPPPPAEREAPEAVKPVPSARPPERVVPIAAKAAEAIEREPGKRVLATPHTRRLARELGIDIATVIGSGRGGRITDDDVRETVGKAAPPPPKAPTAAAVVAPATAGFDFEKYGPTRREPFKGVHKRTAEVMARSWSTVPHVSHFDEADVTELLKVVRQERPYAEERKVKLTFLAFLTKAAADALRKYPKFNCSLDETTGELVYKEYFNVGFATDTEAGLMVPVVRDVDRKSILEIAGEIQELSRRARDRTIDLEQMRGGTFTITNVGALGGTYATPIIVHPEVAILCSLRANERAVVKDGEITVRTIMPLTISFDHRVLDGADAARFMTHIVTLLQDPMRMLVEVA
jgi:pyruvate dehydrogenase E2 component (dihydrolipoamide acetyltransferase)